MFRVFSILICFVFSITSYGQDYRSYTDTNGRKLQGELLSFDGETAKLKLKNNFKRVSVPLEMLCKEDQQWLKAHSKVLQAKKQLFLSVKQTKFGREIQNMTTKEKRKHKRDHGTKLKTLRRFHEYEVQLQNRGEKPMSNLELEFAVYKQTAKGTLRGHSFHKSTKNESLGSLDAREQRVVTLDSAKVVNASADDESEHLKVAPVAGVVVSIKQNGAVVKSVSHPPSLESTLRQMESHQDYIDAIKDDNAKRTKRF